MATATEAIVEIEADTTPSAVHALEYPDEQYEVVNDQIVEEPRLGAYEKWVATRIVRAIVRFDLDGALGEAYEEGLFILERAPRLRRSPDVAFVSRERWPVDLPAPREAAWDVIPDLAVEVISPNDLVRDIMDKIDEYFRVGVRTVWVIHPVHELVYNYDSPTSVRILKRGDTLDGGAVLPGFQVALDDLFGETKRDEPAPEA